MNKIDVKDLNELFKIDDGVLVWDAPTRGKRVKGNPAGCVNKGTGQVIVEILGKGYPVSHIVWAIKQGNYPKYKIEHINGDKLDNGMGNLREFIPDSLTIDYKLVKRCFDYINGHLIWKDKPAIMSVCKIGEKAGYVSKQKDSEYRYIKVGGKRYKAANLVWLYHNKRLPSKILDHINHVKHDDRIENLREVTTKENLKNSTIRKTNTSGVTGIYLNKMSNKWVARIHNDDGDRITLGSFHTLEAAISVRKAAEKIFNYHENHGAES